MKHTLLFFRHALAFALFFCITTLKAQTIYYSKITGNLNSTGTWGTNPDGSGPSPANFSTANCLYIITNTSTASIGAAWTVSGTGSRVQAGDGINPAEFVIPAAFAFNGTIDVADNATVTTLRTTGPTFGVLSPASTVRYDRAGNQTVPATAYYNLILSGAGIKSLANTTDATISGLITIDTAVSFRVQTLNTLTTTLSGTITGEGSLLGNGNSNVIISGSGDFGTIKTATALLLRSLVINRSSGTISLGSNLTVSTDFTHSMGIVDLNGRLLTLNGSITFPASIANGLLRGSPTSSLTIGTSTLSITGALFMDQNVTGGSSLSRLGFNRAGQSLILGNHLSVEDNFVHNNGIINLNDQELQISGVITFPSNAVSGMITGSPTSSLTIGGAGTISNSIKIDQTNSSSRTFHSLTIDRSSGTLVFGSDIICQENFTHLNGAVSIGATQLTLNGAISFPMAATNGSFTGSTTSSLVISGSGPVTNSIFMSQTSAAARTFDSFQFNRQSETLTLGNGLIVRDLQHDAGMISLDGNLLTLSRTVTFPASLNNGAFRGSPTSSLSIASSTAPVTNALLFDQSNSQSRTLSSFTLARLSQTITLGNNLSVSDSFVHTSGVINLAGTLFSISGNIIFPTTVANGGFIGSPTSSLVISGNGTSSNTLKMNQASDPNRSLHSLTVDRTGSILTLGDDLICENNFALNSGSMAIGANQLILNGSITFPVAAANGGFVGSGTSSLVISGSGPITNSIFMSQISAAAQTFNNFRIDRAGAILSLGSSLTTNVFSQISGQINLNGSHLTINSAATFPSALSAGSFIGSLSSSLTISGSGTITNTLKMDQTNASTRSLYNLTFRRPGQTLVLGNPLEIRNAVTPSGGTLASGTFLTLKADAARSAMVGVVGGVLSGTITVETHAPGSATGWALLGPSGINGLTVADWESQLPMTCFGCPKDENSTGSYFVSIQGFNEAGSGSAAYVPLSYTSALTRGVGYWVYLGTGSHTTSAITYSVSGAIVAGNVSRPLTVSANTGLNLIANPYAAPIDWDLVAADASNSNIDGSVHFYNADIDQYVSYVGGISSPSGYIADGVIPMGQGFYVQAVSAGNLIFRESHKSTSNTGSNPLLRTEKEKAETGNVLRLTLQGADGQYDETTIRLHPESTTGFDRAFDAHKILQRPAETAGNPAHVRKPTISSRIASLDYAINSIPATSDTILIPILVKVYQTGSFVITSQGIADVFNESCLLLKDRTLGIVHDLKKEPYTCSISDTTMSPRFELKLCPASSQLTVQDSPHRNVMIGQNGNTILISTDFENDVRAIVNIRNLLGQDIISSTELSSKETTTLDLSEYSGQVVIVTIQNEIETISRKVILH